MQERNINLDYFKLLLATLVMTIHLDPYPSTINFIIGDGLARIAVPCFLIINGYFLSNVISNKKAFVSYLKKLTLIYTVWMIIYSGFYIEALFEAQSIKDIIKFLLIILTGYWHMWYIGALIIASIILYITRKLNKYFLLSLSLFLFLFGYFIYNLQLINTDSYPASIRSILSFLYLYKGNLIRNFLCMGFPFLYIGYFLRNSEFNIKKSTNAILIIIFTLLLIVESKIFLTKTFNLFSVGNDYRLSLLLLCPLLVIFVVKNPRLKIDDGYISRLATAIYFIHPLIINTISSNFRSYQYIFLILFLSTILGIGLIILNKRIKIFL